MTVATGASDDTGSDDNSNDDNQDVMFSGTSLDDALEAGLSDYEEESGDDKDGDENDSDGDGGDGDSGDSDASDSGQADDDGEGDGSDSDDDDSGEEEAKKDDKKDDDSTDSTDESEIFADDKYGIEAVEDLDTLPKTEAGDIDVQKAFGGAKGMIEFIEKRAVQLAKNYIGEKAREADKQEYSNLKEQQAQSDAYARQIADLEKSGDIPKIVNANDPNDEGVKAVTEIVNFARSHNAKNPDDQITTLKAANREYKIAKKLEDEKKSKEKSKEDAAANRRKRAGKVGRSVGGGTGKQDKYEGLVSGMSLDDVLDSEFDNL